MFFRRQGAGIRQLRLHRRVKKVAIEHVLVTRGETADGALQCGAEIGCHVDRVRNPSWLGGGGGAQARVQADRPGVIHHDEVILQQTLQ